jgi:hypothetical protein
MRLHSERLKPGQASYFRHVITEFDELNALYTSYRATKSRVAASIANPFAKPMRVREVAARLSQYDPANFAVFNRYTTQFVSSEAPPVVEVPAYSLQNCGFLLLDGIHRAVALARAHRAFQLFLVVLDGPLDRRILIDLKYWDGGLLTLPTRLRNRLF